MYNITSYERNTNQNAFEISSLPRQNTTHWKTVRVMSLCVNWNELANVEDNINIRVQTYIFRMQPDSMSFISLVLKLKMFSYNLFWLYSVSPLLPDPLYLCTHLTLCFNFSLQKKANKGKTNQNKSRKKH